MPTRRDDYGHERFAQTSVGGVGEHRAPGLPALDRFAAAPTFAHGQRQGLGLANRGERGTHHAA
jgi:hypothetical protein